MLGVRANTLCAFAAVLWDWGYMLLKGLGVGSLQCVLLAVVCLWASLHQERPAVYLKTPGCTVLSVFLFPLSVFPFLVLFLRYSHSLHLHLLLCCSPQFGAVWWQLKWFLSITKYWLSHCWLFQVWWRCRKTKEKMEGRREDSKLNMDYIDGTTLSGHGLKALRYKGWAEGWWEDAGSWW